MKKMFYFFFVIIFSAVTAGNVYAQKTTCITPADIIKVIDPAERVKFLDFLEQQVQQPLPPQQVPLPDGFAQAEEIYFKQRISFKDPEKIKDIVYTSSNKVKKEYLSEPSFFKLALDKTKKYVLLDLENLQETASNTVNYYWGNFKSKYAYKFNFQLVTYENTPYLFITVRTVIKQQENIPYAFVLFKEVYPNIIFEGNVYEKDDYNGFSKKILKIK